MDFLKELHVTFGESLTIEATWLNPLSKQNQKVDEPPQYSLVLSAEFDNADMQILKGILARRKLEIKKENGLWIITGALA